MQHTALSWIIFAFTYNSANLLYFLLTLFLFLHSGIMTEHSVDSTSQHSMSRKWSGNTKFLLPTLLYAVRLLQCIIDIYFFLFLCKREPTNNNKNLKDSNFTFLSTSSTSKGYFLCKFDCPVNLYLQCFYFIRFLDTFY